MSTPIKPLEAMLERLRALTGATSASVLLAEDGGLVPLVACGPAHALDPGLCERVLRAGEPWVGPHAILVPVPGLALVVVSSDRPGSFQAHDLAILELACDLLPAALAPAHELTRVIDTQRDIARAGLDLEHVMELIVERAMDLTCGEGAMVSLIDGDDLVVRAAGGIAAGTLAVRRPTVSSVAVHAFAARDTLLIRDTESDPRIDAAMRAAVGDTSLICVPLFQGAAPVAALNVMSASATERLGESDRRTLELLAVALSAAVSRAAEFQAKREQVDALARFEAVFANTLTSMMILTLDGRILGANPALQALLGGDSGELEGRLVADFVHPEDRDVAWASATRVLAGDARSTAEHRYVTLTGDVVWVEASLSLVRDADGAEGFLIATFQDLTRRKAAEDELRAQAALNEHQALHDSLTELPNRTLFRDRLEHALHQARRGDRTVAVLMLDLDRFKAINDSHGHAVGDEVLVAIGRRLHTLLRASDTVARIGGDEFAVVLPDPSSLDDVMVAVQRVRAAIREPIAVNGMLLEVDVSIGVARFPRDGGSVESLLQRADAAMYESKREHAGAR